MRLIDANNLLKIFDERLKVYEGKDGTKERYAYIAWLRSYHAIKDAPTIDAVEVVRCKDCRFAEHREQAERVYCHRERLAISCPPRDNDDFCKYGERSEE